MYLNRRIQRRYRGESKIYEEPARSIVKIAHKYHVDPINFVDAFVEAWRNKENNYENLTVVCRVVKDDSATFLITNNEKVVSQFPIKIESLRNPVTLKNYVSSISISKRPKKEV